MRKNRIIILILTVLIILIGVPKSSLAMGFTSSELKKQIETEYGFFIDVPKVEFAQASEDDRIFFYKDLDDSLKSLNKEFMKEITSYYKGKGIKSTIKIDLPSWSFESAGYFSLNNNVALISVEGLHPQNRQSINKYTLAHEIGHMLNAALDYKEGSTNIKNNWIKIDDKEIDKSKSHVTTYAQTSFREDFAETFAYMASRSKQDELFKIMVKEANSIIIGKVDYLDSLISKHFKSYKGLDTFNFFKPQEPSKWSKKDIDKMISQGRLNEPFINKYQANISRGEFCELLVRGMYKSYSYTEGLEDYQELKFQNDYFDDINPYNFELKGIECYAINKIRSLGLINGKSERYFDYSGLITRQEVAVIIKNTAEHLKWNENDRIELPFADNDKIAPWAIDAVEYVYNNSIMNGIEDDKFDPLGYFTFEQAYIIIDRLFNEL